MFGPIQRTGHERNGGGVHDMNEALGETKSEAWRVMAGEGRLERLQMIQHSPEELLGHFGIAGAVGVGERVLGRGGGGAQRRQGAGVKAQGVTHVVETEAVSQLGIKQTDDLAPGRENAPSVFDAGVAGQFGHLVRRNQIAKLAENGELAGGWLVVLLFHALPCGRAQTRKPTFFYSSTLNPMSQQCNVFILIMKRTGLLSLAIFGLIPGLSGGDFTAVPLNSNDVVEVSQKLNQYENGKITLDDLTQNGKTEPDQKLVSYYLSHPNSVTVKMKLPISRCFAAADDYQDAAKLAADYILVYSNDWHGWKILGGANLGMGNYSAAVAALTNSARLGDDGSYAPLAFAALKSDQLDVVHNILPQLFALKHSKSSGVVRLDIVGVLVIYSLKTDGQDIFVKALDGVSGKQIVSRDDLHQLVMTGCNRFKGEDINKIRQEVEAAAANDSSSAATNAPSP